MDKLKTGRFPLFTLVKVLIAAYLVTVVLLLALAGLLFKFELGESIIDGGIIITYILSCFLGGFLMGKLQKTRKFLWGMVLGCAYYAILLGVSLALKQSGAEAGGNVGTSLVLCIGSGMLGGMLS